MNDDIMIMEHQHEVNIQRAGDRGAAACCGARRQVTTSAQTACVEYGPPEARFWSNLSISTFFSLLCWLPPRKKSSWPKCIKTRSHSAIDLVLCSANAYSTTLWYMGTLLRASRGRAQRDTHPLCGTWDQATHRYLLHHLTGVQQHHHHHPTRITDFEEDVSYSVRRHEVKRVRPRLSHCSRGASRGQRVGALSHGVKLQMRRIGDEFACLQVLFPPGPFGSVPRWVATDNRPTCLATFSACFLHQRTTDRPTGAPRTELLGRNAPPSEAQH